MASNEDGRSTRQQSEEHIDRAHLRVVSGMPAPIEQPRLETTDLSDVVFVRVTLPRNIYIALGANDPNHCRLAKMTPQRGQDQLGIYLERISNQKHLIATLRPIETGYQYDSLQRVKPSKFLIKNNIGDFCHFDELDIRNAEIRARILGPAADTALHTVQIPNGHQCVDSSTGLMIHPGWFGSHTIFQPHITIARTAASTPTPLGLAMAELAYALHTHNTGLTVGLRQCLEDMLLRLSVNNVSREYTAEAADVYPSQVLSAQREQYLTEEQIDAIDEMDVAATARWVLSGIMNGTFHPPPPAEEEEEETPAPGGP